MTDTYNISGQGDLPGLVDKITDLARLAASEPIQEVDRGPLYLVRNEDGTVELVDTDKYRQDVRRVERSSRVKNVDSFVAALRRAVDMGHVDEVGGEAMAEVYARPKSLVVSALLNPRTHRDSTITLDFEASTEWEAWTKASGKLVPQLELADFLEDQQSVILEPDGAELLEIVQSIQAHSKVSFESAEWLKDGRRQFSYREDVEASSAGSKGQFSIPAEFKVALRPFVGSDPFAIIAKLRYRIQGGNLLIGFKLVEPERRLEAAFQEQLTVLGGALESANLDFPIYLGSA